jgi:hypothetical protein
MASQGAYEETVASLGTNYHQTLEMQTHNVYPESMLREVKAIPNAIEESVNLGEQNSSSAQHVKVGPYFNYSQATFSYTA